MVDAGVDMTPYIDMDSIVQPEKKKSKQPRVVLNPPEWAVEFFDAEAERRGISRRACMNTALVEWADEQKERELRLKKAQ